MTLVDAETGELLPEMTEDEYLEGLASRIRSEHKRSTEAIGDLLDVRLAIGQCLLEARQTLASDAAFGQWFAAQEFGFTQQWARTLRAAAEVEPALRAAVQTQVCTGEGFNFKKVVLQLTTPSAAGNSATRRPKRGNLADSARSAGWELRRAVERIETIAADDRFTANKEQVAAEWSDHLTNAVKVCQDLLDGFTTGPQEAQ